MPRNLLHVCQFNSWDCGSCARTRVTYNKMAMWHLLMLVQPANSMPSFHSWRGNCFLLWMTSKAWIKFCYGTCCNNKFNRPRQWARLCAWMYTVDREKRNACIYTLELIPMCATPHITHCLSDERESVPHENCIYPQTVLAGDELTLFRIPYPSTSHSHWTWFNNGGRFFDALTALSKVVSMWMPKIYGCIWNMWSF